MTPNTISRGFAVADSNAHRRDTDVAPTRYRRGVLPGYPLFSWPLHFAPLQAAVTHRTLQKSDTGLKDRARLPRMLQKQALVIDDIRVPVKRAKTLDPEKVEALATDILEHGQITPIRVRKDGEKFVLIEGYHRLEAMRALGEDAIAAYIVHARLH
jgi:hypothetical protein